MELLLITYTASCGLSTEVFSLVCYGLAMTPGGPKGGCVSICGRSCLHNNLIVYDRFRTTYLHEEH